MVDNASVAKIVTFLDYSDFVYSRTAIVRLFWRAGQNET